jgi:tRNA-Thr(GGU) m(6)t(6)A37 methyltransferase TsaA
MKYCLVPIGFVERGLPRYKSRTKIRSKYEYIAVIRIYDEFLDGLIGLEEYSHLIIVFFMDKVEETRLLVKPWGDPKYPNVGIFSTRFPPRPNPIGLSVVELIKVGRKKIYVRGLDAWTNTPIVDIKPYDYHDMVKGVRVPQWFIDAWNKNYVEKRYYELVPWLGPT